MKIVLNQIERKEIKEKGYVIRSFKYSEIIIYLNGSTEIINHIDKIVGI